MKKITLLSPHSLNEEAIRGRDLLLRSEFVQRNSVSRTVCQKCGHIQEIDLVVVNGLLKTMELLGKRPEIFFQKDEELREFYFEVGYCRRCQEWEEEKNPLFIKLVNINRGET